jgi:ppGpp synthetase/RelA/SpoT-type nucleotidyltranferase
MSSPSAIYDQASYVAWHESEIPADAPLLEGLTALRDELVHGAPSRFVQLGQLLSQIARYAKVEAKLSTKSLLSGEFNLPMDELAKKSGFSATTFKSTASILDKLWRKNRLGPNVNLANLRAEITDLVRVSVVAPTHLHARIYAERLQLWDELIAETDRSEHLANIFAINVDAEAKLASGYFAYHALVKFHDGFVVEVQIYSAIAAAWRDLSHHLYERVRIGQDTLSSHGGVSARLVSLGHLLHLAECELERLTDDLK